MASFYFSFSNMVIGGNATTADLKDTEYEYELFRKQLSESDIRSGLAVPVRVASTSCMPSLLNEEKMLLKVTDREQGRLWVFVYSKSRGISTLTGGGWRVFVTNKGLRAGDVVRFSWSKLYYLIDIVKKDEGNVDQLMTETETETEIMETEAEAEAKVEEQKAVGDPMAGEMRSGQKTRKKVFGVWLEFE